MLQRREGSARVPVATLSVIDPQGRFEARVAGGDYDLLVSTPDQAHAAVTAPAGATAVRIVLGTGRTLRGTVVASEDGTPIAGAVVGPQVAERNFRTPTVLPTTTTRDDGTFELTGIAAGPLAIQVWAHDYTVKLEELPAAGDVLGPVTIALVRGPRRGGFGPLIGIGVRFVPAGDALRVVEVLPGSGALDAGMIAGDQIVAIDGVPVARLSVDAASASIRGPAGSDVTLTVRRAGAERRFTVRRRQLQS